MSKGKLIGELFFILCVIVVSVFYFGENIGDVLTEMALFYGIWFVLAIAVTAFIFWAMTKSMNSRKQAPKKDEL